MRDGQPSDGLETGVTQTDVSQNNRALLALGVDDPPFYFLANSGGIDEPFDESI